MAYPSPIKTSGALSTGGDIFEYFKGATQAFLNEIPQSEYTDEYWGAVRTWMKSQSYPVSRSAFNTIINNNFPDSADLLSSNEPPSSGWSIYKVYDWAKVQSFIRAIFGESGATTSSGLSGSMGNVSGWSRYDLVLLRFGLVRFDNYGSCYPDATETPPPTNPVTNVGARTFNWTNAPGYGSVSNYEYSIAGAPFKNVTSKPLNVGNLLIPAGALRLRTKEHGYLDASSVITNNAEYPLANWSVTVQVFVSGFNYTANIRPSYLYVPVTVAVTVTGVVEFYDMNSILRSFTYTVTLPANQDFGTNNAPTGQPQAPVWTNSAIKSGIPSPTTVPPGSRLVRVEY